MFASEFLDRLDALSDGPRHPVAPRFVGVFEPSLRYHTLDRRHVYSLPMVETKVSHSDRVGFWAGIVPNQLLGGIRPGLRERNRPVRPHRSVDLIGLAQSR